MESLDRETIVSLARHLGWPAVSLYLPTHRGHTETLQDIIRFKNLIKSAEETLAGSGMRSADVDATLKGARTLLDDAAFWKRLGNGLAVFLGQDVRKIVRTDVEMPERVSVSDRFLIRPLLPALHGDERFFVLALSKNRVRLLEGKRDEVHELDLAGAPKSLAEALAYDDYERQVQFHTRTPAAAGGRGHRMSSFHGHGGLPDVAKDNLLRYFRAIDRGLHELLRDDSAPLVLAGVDYLVPIYREANSYPHLVGETMRGNPDELTPFELHAEAMLVLEPHFRRELESDLDELDQLIGTAASSADLREIVAAAFEGRIKVLFVPQTAEEWGRFDPGSGHVEIHDDRLPGDWELSDLAAAETLLHGGTVHALTAEEAEPAAIFRY